MTTTIVIDDFLSAEELAWILQQENVIEKKDQLTSVDKIRFTIDVRESIRIKLQLPPLPFIPMMWVSGNTSSHIDVGEENFSETVLVYISESSSQESLIVGDETYEIKANRCFRFPKGTEHRTEGSIGEPRLLIGPMSDLGIPVGASADAVFYYATYSDVFPTVNSGNEIYTDIYTPPNDVIISASNTFPDSSTIPPPSPGLTLMGWAGKKTDGLGGFIEVSYTLGQVLTNTGNTAIYLYPLWSQESKVMCFKEGAKILCLDPEDNQEKYLPVQDLRRGVLVKTSENGYKPIVLIGHSKIYNQGDQIRHKNKLYRCHKGNYPELTEDLIITSCHCILVPDLTEKEREDTESVMGNIYVTEHKYRLMACLDERAEPYEEEGIFTIWHFALENEHEHANYGVYANGLLVETSSIRMMKMGETPEDGWTVPVYGMTLV